MSVNARWRGGSGFRHGLLRRSLNGTHDRSTPACGFWFRQYNPELCLDIGARKKAGEGTRTLDSHVGNLRSSPTHRAETAMTIAPARLFPGRFRVDSSLFRTVRVYAGYTGMPSHFSLLSLCCSYSPSRPDSMPLKADVGVKFCRRPPWFGARSPRSACEAVLSRMLKRNTRRNRTPEGAIKATQRPLLLLQHTVRSIKSTTRSRASTRRDVASANAMTVADDAGRNRHHGATFCDPKSGTRGTAFHHGKTVDRKRNPGSAFHWLPDPPRRCGAGPAGKIAVVAVVAATGATRQRDPGPAIGGEIETNAVRSQVRGANEVRGASLVRRDSARGMGGDATTQSTSLTPCRFLGMIRGGMSLLLPCEMGAVI